MAWKKFEEHVKTVASFKWDRPAISKSINGVMIDCVVEYKRDHFILVEITQEKNLNKLRTDLAKFASVRPYLFSQGIYCECYFVCESDPPPSLRTTGSGEKVTVLSFLEFNKLFFDFNSYSHVRTQRKFGSAVDHRTGESDLKEYVPVKYVEVNSGNQLTIQNLAKALNTGKRIVLLGNFATGKSRCIKELFSLLSINAQNDIFYPIAIDLRDNWGSKRGTELIRRHFDDLGLSHETTNGVVKILDKTALCFLLDGFDEIGSQPWSDDPSRLSQIRSEALKGVRDLIKTSKGGIFITGREHYFNSDAEMFQCLGLREDSTMVIRCPDEFTESEMQAYLRQFEINIDLPSWLPRRPLICQLIADIDPKIITSLSKQNTPNLFWDSLLKVICDREAKIHTNLEPYTIRRVLRLLARMTRSQNASGGTLSLSEISSTFKTITGGQPSEESTVMLQRLPCLGRVSSETSERQFVDFDILDVLMAEDVQDLAEESKNEDVIRICNERWVNPLKRLGLTILSENFSIAPDIKSYINLMHNAAIRQNGVLAGDILASLLISGKKPEKHITLCDSHITFLDLSSNRTTNININQSTLEEVDITGCNTDGVLIQDCLINHLIGVSSSQGLPPWIINTPVDKYDSLSTISRIRHADLSREQCIFLTLVKKLFFQPGAGRKEDALLRGLGEAADQKITGRILNQFIREGIITVHKKSNKPTIYAPNREYTHRMRAIMNELTLNQDPLWTSLKK